VRKKEEKKKGKRRKKEKLQARQKKGKRHRAGDSGCHSLKHRSPKQHAANAWRVGQQSQEEEKRREIRA